LPLTWVLGAVPLLKLAMRMKPGSLLGLFFGGLQPAGTMMTTMPLMKLLGPAV
jgi:hypothetical protein